MATLNPINGAPFSFHGTVIKEAADGTLIRRGKMSKNNADKEGK